MKNKHTYRPLSRREEPLACFCSEHGHGRNREYLALLSPYLMQEIDLAHNTTKMYRRNESDGPLDEYLALETGLLEELGYEPCSFDDYLLAQDILADRLKGTPNMKLRIAGLDSVRFTGGRVPV